MKGITLNIADTAGIRDTEDAVERIGVDKQRNPQKDADLLIYVTDASVSLDENDEEIINMLKGQKAVVLLNKTGFGYRAFRRNFERKDSRKRNYSYFRQGKQGIDLLEETLKNMFLKENCPLMMKCILQTCGIRRRL